MAETDRLQKENGLQQVALNDVIVEAAQRSGASRATRQVVAAAERSLATDGMLLALLEPTAADVDWILDDLWEIGWMVVLAAGRAGSASHDQLRSIIARPGILAKVVDLVGGDESATELLALIIETVPMDAGDLVGPRHATADCPRAPR